MKDQGLAFDEVLLPKGVPQAIVKDEHGDYYIQIKADKTQKVTFMIGEAKYPCNKTKEGIWRLKFPFHAGIHFVQLLMDNTPVLSPYLPIGYGYCRPYNYVTIPTEDECFHSVKDVPHGEVRKNYFYSTVTSSWGGMVVYTPPCYETETDKKFPVLYLQHGHGENEMAWTTVGRMNWILDNLLAEKKIKPFLVVMNNGMVQTEVPSRGRVVDYTLFEKSLLKDIIPFVEAHFRVIKNKENRALAGLSMGSIQTSRTAFAHPDYFSGIGLFSGFMHDFLQGSKLDMIDRGASDQSHLQLLDNPERFHKEFKVFFRAIGNGDPFINEFLADDKMCKEKGIYCERKVYQGIHDWNVWRMCIRDFAQLIFQ